MLPVQCQDASLCRVSFFLFFFPSSTTRSSWAEHYVADERKEGPRGRSICLNHLWNGVDHHRATISHLVASRFVLFLSLSSIAIDRGREERWQKISRIGPIESSSGPVSKLPATKERLRRENIGVGSGRVKNFYHQVSTRIAKI